MTVIGDKKKCPANLKIKCEFCPYSKEGLCDYPYIGTKRIPINGDKNAELSRD